MDGEPRWILSGCEILVGQPLLIISFPILDISVPIVFRSDFHSANYTFISSVDG